MASENDKHIISIAMFMYCAMKGRE